MENTYDESIIKLEQLISNGAVREDYSEFKKSIFKDVYEKAESLVIDIVKYNKNWRMEKERNYNEEFEGANTISFVGRRGTGKTSCMWTFTRAMTEWKGLGNKLFSCSEVMNNVTFTELEHIDATTLNDGDDLFSIILANMFNEILNVKTQRLDTTESYEKRTLFQKFEEVYNDFMTLQMELKKYDEYATYEKLKNLADSRKIREKFAELVESYLSIINDTDKYGRNAKESYLVISIDDLDLAIQKNKRNENNWGTYKIMSIINKYLMVPRVIVFTAYNHKNLIAHCHDYYKAQYPDEGIKYAETASQFMEKVFPIYTRVYMPSWRKRDFATEEKVKVNFSQAEILLSFQKSGVSELPVKKFMFAFFAERADIYFDPLGRKKHFFEPDTMRTLFNTVELLTKLKPYDHESQKQEDLVNFKYNIKRLKEDCFFRFKEEKIVKPQEKNMFDIWMEEPIDRRLEKMMRTFSINLKQLGKEGKEKQDVSSLVYGYSELIHGLFHATRKASTNKEPQYTREVFANEEYQYTKEFVSTILYSCTLHLTERYREYNWYKQKIDKDEYIAIYRESIVDRKEGNENISNQVSAIYKELKNVIGKEVCGRWSEYFFPEIKYRDSQMTISYGAPEKGPFVIGYGSKFRATFELKMSNDFEKRENLVKAFLFVAMMYENAVTWTKDSIEWKLENNVLIAKLRTDRKSDFDLNGFYKNTFCYPELLNRMEQILLQSLSEFDVNNVWREKKMSLREAQDEYKETIQIQKEQVSEWIKQCFDKIWEEYYDWDFTYGSMVLPMQSLDITYNFIKRIYAECRNEHMDPILLVKSEENKEFWQAYKKMLDRFRNYLRKIDDYYHIVDDKMSFEKIYVNCPYYKWMKQFAGNSESEHVKSITGHIIARAAERASIDEMLIEPREFKF